MYYLGTAVEEGEEGGAPQGPGLHQGAPHQDVPHLGAGDPHTATNCPGLPRPLLPRAAQASPAQPSPKALILHQAPVHVLESQMWAQNTVSAL